MVPEAVPEAVLSSSPSPADSGSRKMAWLRELASFRIVPYLVVRLRIANVRGFFLEAPISFAPCEYSHSSLRTDPRDHLLRCWEFWQSITLDEEEEKEEKETADNEDESDESRFDILSQ